MIGSAERRFWACSMVLDSMHIAWPTVRLTSDASLEIIVLEHICVLCVSEIERGGVEAERQPKRENRKIELQQPCGNEQCS